ncbi:hypothetical protein F5B18DRAFT_656644 [Nemania serpens]|nr:hypothetical protein F5B18DRAFT_656644 [Nemania serpens]
MSSHVFFHPGSRELAMTIQARDDFNDAMRRTGQTGRVQAWVEDQLTRMMHRRYPAVFPGRAPGSFKFRATLAPDPESLASEFLTLAEARLEREAENERASEEFKPRSRGYLYDPRPPLPRAMSSLAAFLRELRGERPHWTPLEQDKFRHDQAVRDWRRARRRRRQRHPDSDIRYTANFWQLIEPETRRRRRDRFGGLLLSKLKRAVFKPE